MNRRELPDLQVIVALDLCSCFPKVYDSFLILKPINITAFFILSSTQILSKTQQLYVNQKWLCCINHPQLESIYFVFLASVLDKK